MDMKKHLASLRLRAHMLRHLFDDKHMPSHAAVSFTRVPGGVTITTGHAGCTCGAVWGGSSHFAATREVRKIVADHRASHLPDESRTIDMAAVHVQQITYEEHA